MVAAKRENGLFLLPLPAPAAVVTVTWASALDRLALPEHGCRRADRGVRSDPPAHVSNYMDLEAEAHPRTHSTDSGDPCGNIPLHLLQQAM